ncbi:sigma-54-dependent Fis family transcriptional regulator [bacterium DOLZORAL124_64_63]|nr:MAG: sigma-54-dependent Fis family transcriptional regulator [bacterium DOLZORAL124_64_63]
MQREVGVEKRHKNQRRDVSIARLLGQVQSGSILSIISNLREGILALDPELNILTMNPAAEEILGRSRWDLAGTPVCSLFGAGSCPRDLLAETLRAGEPIVDFQTTVELGPGRQGHVLLRTVPLKDRDGEYLGLALLLGDVTEVTNLLRQMNSRSALGNLVGRDARMQELFQLIVDVADSEATVLIRGESGTGKELVAQAVHERSRRRAGPFVQVNCSALSEPLLESELFGHVKGAYTGAVGDRRGRFEEADGGTIFLDEIGDVSPVVQVKLLRVLQERTIERVGDSQPIAVDVRVVSATNRNLESLLATGQLREDFYYRIRVLTLNIPPLRDRREDIPLLTHHFLARIARRQGRPDEPLVMTSAMRRLMHHRWPGNVRELENALEHAMVLSRGGAIEAAHLPPELAPDKPAGPSRRDVPLHSEAEKAMLAEALQETGWHRSRAARRLGMDRTTLWRKIREYGLQPPEER